MALPTIRINELPARTVGVELALTDALPIWVYADNKTKKVTLQDLNTFFAIGGGGGSHPPVVARGEYIYIVPPAHATTVNAIITSLVGLDFTLERGGMPLIALLADNSNVAVAEYEILNAGGFKLLQPFDELVLNERFKLTISSLIGGGGGGTTTSGGSFIVGKKIVNVNTTLDPATEMNKVIQIRGAGVPITLTIPDIGDIAANSIIPIETSVSNTYPAKIQTTGGQYIYMSNQSKTSISMMPGEVCWLYRDTDGLYIINDFAERYKQLAMPVAAFAAGLNQLVCKGQIVNRADYPRLWEVIQTFGSSFVSDATWLTASAVLGAETIAYPYRGCFSSGDGSLTFRLPDLMNTFLRGVKTEIGSDTERFLNKPGGYQVDKFKEHSHGYIGVGTVASAGGSSSTRRTGDFNLATEVEGGIETRPGNIGVLWVINS